MLQWRDCARLGSMPDKVNFPAAVSAVPLRQVATLRGGYTFRTAIPEIAGGGVLAVQLRNFQRGQGPDWRTVIETAPPRWPSDHEWLQPGDILFAFRGTRFFTTLLEDVPRPAVASGQFMIIQVQDAHALCPEFLAWQLNQAPAQAYFERSAEGTAQRSLTREVVESMMIVVPPLAFQRSVVHLAQLAKRERAALEEILRIREAQLNHVAASLHSAVSAEARE
jgi:hypothetical protein